MGRELHNDVLPAKRKSLDPLRKVKGQSIKKIPTMKQLSALGLIDSPCCVSSTPRTFYSQPAKPTLKCPHSR